MNKKFQHFIPKIWADGSKDISMTGECLPMVHFYNDVCELSFIIQGLELLKNGTGVDSIYPVVVGA